MSKDVKIAEPSGRSGGGSDSASPWSSLGPPSAWLQATGASSVGTAPVASLAEQTPSGSQEIVPGSPGKISPTTAAPSLATPPLSRGGDAASKGSQEVVPGSPGKISPTTADPSLATPPAFPGTLGVEPRLPDGAGSRAMLQAQEGHARPSGALPAVPSGALKAGTAEASGAEGPRDEQGVGPFGGGGAQYTASLGLSTPEPMHIDDRGRADVSAYRGKSNGIAHEWAQAYVDKAYAYSKLLDAETKEEAAYWAERAEDAEIRLNRADEEIDRSGDADTIAKQAWEDKDRLQQREDRARAREAAAADRAAQRLERKGRAWRSNRRHQINERDKHRDQRRERRLEGQLSEESMDQWHVLQNGTEDGNVLGINQLRDRLEEIEDKLDDPRTSPSERALLELEKKKIEDQIEEKKLDQYWLEHGGFPCAELDCCDAKYRKCRPPCDRGAKCVCQKPANCPDPPAEKKDEGDDGKDKDKKNGDKGPITPGSVAGGHAGKGAQPPGTELPPDQDGDGRGSPGAKYPDDVGGDVEADAESPDDGRPRGGASWQGGGDAPPHVFPAGDKKYPLKKVGDDWYVQGDNGLWYRLQVTVAPPVKEVGKDGEKKYDLKGIKRDPFPTLTGRLGHNRLKAYWEAAKAIGTETTGLIAQVLGAFAGTSYYATVKIGSWITGESQPTMDELVGPLSELIATTDFANLSEFEGWAVSTLASLIEGFAAPGNTFKQFAKGLIESPRALAQMMKDAVNGDEKAQLSLLLFAATLRPGEIVASAKALMGKVRSISASAIRSLEKLGVTIDDVIEAIEKKPGAKVRVAIDRSGQLTKIEAVGEVKPPGSAGSGSVVERAQPKRAAASGSMEDPTGRKPPASRQEPELVEVSAERETGGAPRGSGEGGSGSESKTAAKPSPASTKKPPVTTAGGGGEKPPKRPTATGGGGDGGPGAEGPGPGSGGPSPFTGKTKITQKGLQHTIDRHGPNSTVPNKSRFAAGENIESLIRGADRTPGAYQPATGNYVRTYDAGRPIGIDRATGGSTSTVTVIVRQDGTLVTAFPGRP